MIKPPERGPNTKHPPHGPNCAFIISSPIPAEALIRLFLFFFFFFLGGHFRQFNLQTSKYPFLHLQLKDCWGNCVFLLIEIFGFLILSYFMLLGWVVYFFSWEEK
ncbi:hypothetical protein GQ457_03G033800 [Hibiscus cannabinus]